MIKEKEKLF